ncbi:TPA: efflux RND transporter permease subunit [Klebsiella pneumoniae]|nr:efflux RND transporter permease subunit [Klebsiella pneumoniae]
MANFFIDRPIFAWVLAILLCLTGALAILSLPVEQYPDLAPPNVRITANYPGASAQTLENTVTQVIEQNMTGLDNLMYMSSQSSATGQATITLSFTAGTDPDEAVQQVQNQLQSAMRKLPQAVQNQGVTVRKTGDTNILTLAFVSTDGSMDKQDIADYVASNIQDPLSRVNGVGDIDAYGSQYSMRIWLDPAKLNSYQMTTKDVTDAISSQNAQIAVGQLGGTPSVDKQALNATINSQSLLQTPEQFRNITLRVNQDGSEVTLGDVATVEMGAEKYDYLSRYNRQPASGLGIKLASGANEMATAERVINRLNELAQFFPHGLEYKVAYETTSFVKASITDVVKTLLEAILLVFLVMYLFLQNFRATLIPTIAVPVVLMGTFAVLYACGYSINTLTMFAMVLAIGLLVDDAIVVVENVERIMSEEGLSPREATRKSMGQIQGALVGIAMVLSAVFVPMAFFGGTTGAIYRQFSITIVAAMVLSVLVAMILTPALCATLLKPVKPGESHERTGFFGWFNRTFNRSASRYETFVGKILHRSLRWMLIYVLLLGGMVFLCLAALYESWSVPFSVMLVVPLGVIGALLATWMRGLENDVYFQVGLLTVIGLSAKNAILIVEFANELNEKGQDLLSATLSACRQRLRPILMTSLAFIFGVLPMATSTGAGSGSQHAVGTGVMGGMISATVLAIFFVPLFFVLVRRRFPLKERPQ